MKNRTDWRQIIRANTRQISFVCIAFFLMVFIGCYSVSFVIRREALSSVTIALNESEKTIRSYMREPNIAFSNVHMTVRDMLDNGATHEEILDYFQRASYSMSQRQGGVMGFVGIYAFIEGEFLNSAGLKPGSDFVPQESPWYRMAVRSNEAAFTTPYQDPLTGRTIFSLAHEIYGKDGTYWGVLSFNIDLSWVFQYASSLQLAEGGYGMILDQYLRVIAHPNEDFINKPLFEIGPDYAEISDLIGMRRPVSAVNVKDYDGSRAIVFFRELYNGWHIGVTLPASSYYADLIRTGFILITLGVVLAAALSFVLLRLSAAKMQSDEDNRSKSSFLAIMSHEIRTPLNAIIGLSEIMLRKDLPDETHTDLVKIYNSGSNLLSIINDILDFSKIEAGSFTLVTAEYDVPSLINDTVQLNLVRLQSDAITFNLEIDDTLPVSLSGDELRVKQVMNNLLSNAFKYTNEGSVTLDIGWTREGDDAVLRFAVSDTGIGIKPGDIEKLFQEYSQVDRMKNRNIQGTGLGLTITKNLVERMGGAIEVSSEYGKGTTFTATIRQRIVDETPIGPTITSNLKNRSFTEDKLDRKKNFERVAMSYARVLVVDDVQTNLDVARGFLRLYKLNVDCVTSGKEAVELIREGTPHYDAIFMDHMMPEMDGVEATRIIRSDIGSDYARDIPIIALTANALVGNEEMLLGKGFDAFISKPINVLRLDAVLHEWIHDRHPEKHQAAAEYDFDEASTNTNLLGGVHIDGVDLDSIARYYDNDEICIGVLRSFAKHTPAILDEMKQSRHDDLRRYAINVHGLKGSARNIGANEVAALAESLEHAAKKDNTAYVEAHAQELAELAEKLLASIDAALEELTDKPDDGERPERDSIDRELLSRMLEAARHFQISDLEDALTEMEKSTYSSGSYAEFVAWLREQTDNFEYADIQKRLEAELQ